MEIRDNNTADYLLNEIIYYATSQLNIHFLPFLKRCDVATIALNRSILVSDGEDFALRLPVLLTVYRSNHLFMNPISIFSTKETFTQDFLVIMKLSFLILIDHKEFTEN